jgi:hypothetical protein
MKTSRHSRVVHIPYYAILVLAVLLGSQVSPWMMSTTVHHAALVQVGRFQVDQSELERFLRPDGLGGKVGWISDRELKRMAVGRVALTSANGCNRNVCISVNGSGTFVDSWQTQALGNFGCSSPHFQSLFYYVGTRICPSSAEQGVYFYNYKRPRNYPDKTWLCNVWLANDIPGKPCIQILA